MSLPKSSLEFIIDHAKPQAKVSVILLDWSVRESFRFFWKVRAPARNCYPTSS